MSESNELITIDSTQWNQLQKRLEELNDMNETLKNDVQNILHQSNEDGDGSQRDNKLVEQQNMKLLKLQEDFDLVNSINKQLRNELSIKNKEYFQIKQNEALKIDDLNYKMKELQSQLEKEKLLNDIDKKQILELSGKSVKDFIENDKKYLKNFTKIEHLQLNLLEVHNQMKLLNKKIMFNRPLQTPNENEDEGIKDQVYNVDYDTDYNSWRTTVEHQEKENLKLVVSKLQERIKTITSTNKDLMKIIKLYNNGKTDEEVLQNCDVSLDFDINNIEDIKRELIKEKYEKTLLEKNFNNFLIDIENRIPSFQNNIVEKHTKKEESTENNLANLHSLELENKSLNLKLKDYETNLELLLQQRSDLGNQVNYLLQLQSYKNNTNTLTEEELSLIRNLVNNPTSFSKTDSQKIISERLLNFSDINELSNQNIKLLSFTRQLTNKLEQIENQNNDDIDNLKVHFNSVEDAKAAIVILRKKNEQYKNKELEYISERDQSLKKIDNLKIEVSNLKNELNVKKDPIIKNLDIQATNKDLLTKNNELSTKLQNLVIEKESLEKQFQLLKNSYKEMKEIKNKKNDLDQSYYSSQNISKKHEVEDIVSLKANCQHLEKTSNSLERQIKKIMIENTGLKSELNKMKIEYDTLKSSSQAGVNFDQNRDTSIVNEYNNNKYLMKEINDLRLSEKQLMSKVEAQQEEIKNLMEKSSSQIKWYQEKIDQMNDDMNIKIAHITSSAESDAALRNKEDIDKLKEQLNEKEMQISESLDRFARLKKQANDRLTEGKATENKLRESIADLENTKTDLNSKLILSETTIRDLQNQINLKIDELEKIKNELDENKIIQSKLEADLKEVKDSFSKKEEELANINVANKSETFDLESITADKLPEQLLTQIKESIKKEFEENNTKIIESKLKELENVSNPKNENNHEISDSQQSALKEEWEKDYQHITKSRIEYAEAQTSKRVKDKLKKEYEEQLTTAKKNIEKEFQEKLQSEIEIAISDIKKDIDASKTGQLKAEMEAQLSEKQNNNSDGASNEDKNKIKLLTKKIELLESQLKIVKAEDIGNNNDHEAVKKENPISRTLSSTTFGQNPFVFNTKSFGGNNPLLTNSSFTNPSFSNNSFATSAFSNNISSANSVENKAFSTETFGKINKQSTPELTVSSITVQPTLTFNADTSSETSGVKRSVDSTFENETDTAKPDLESNKKQKED